MAKFNAPTTGTKTVNLAGGEAYTQTPELELVSILLTSFVEDQFYRNLRDQSTNLRGLLKLVDNKFAAQAAVYARTKFGMRSISHVVASELAKYISGKSWAKDFYRAVIHRPDDMLEIISYHTSREKKIPNAMKKGFAAAFGKFDEYQLAKYRGDNRAWKLIDLVNLVHPVPTEKNGEALKKLVEGKLRSAGTWETELTQAGQIAETDEQKEELKKDAWIKLVSEGKIAYFALLRNLRNILEQAPEVLPKAIEILTDEKRIRKSLVLPFRYLTAYKEIQNLSGKGSRELLMALNQAIDISVKNVPKFDGETLVVLDTSGSMTWRPNSKTLRTPAEIGTLFSAVLVKSNNADFMDFSSDARYQNLNPMDSTLTLAGSINFQAGGTNFHAIFRRANKAYDRIIILSDEQGWEGYDTPKHAFAEYKNKTGANPKVYLFDLQSYGNMQFPEQNVFCIAGFSEKVFDIMKLLEQDKNALINEIKKVEF
jgi:hypothetical protein